MYVSLQVVIFIFHTLSSLRPRTLSRYCDITCRGKSSLPDVGTRRRRRRLYDDDVQPQRLTIYTLIFYYYYVYTYADARNTAHANGTARDGIIKTGLVFFFLFYFIFNSLFPFSNTRTHAKDKTDRRAPILSDRLRSLSSRPHPLSLTHPLTDVYRPTNDLNVSRQSLFPKCHQDCITQYRANVAATAAWVQDNNNYPVYLTGVGVRMTMWFTL